MRPVIGFFLLCWSVAAHAQQPYFQPPTATELFNLRSRCAELGNKFLDDHFASQPLTQSITSHYDPRTNHCYGDVVMRNVEDFSYFIRTLYDLQTEANIGIRKNGNKGQQAIRDCSWSSHGYDERRSRL